MSFVYEITDSSGKSLLELGRFKSDGAAIKAAKNIIVPLRAANLSRRDGARSFAVASIKPSRPSKSKDQLLSELIQFCIVSRDPKISELASQYVYE